MQYSLVKVVVDGIAAHKIDNQLAILDAINSKNERKLMKTHCTPFSACFPPLVDIIHLNLQDYQNLEY